MIMNKIQILFAIGFVAMFSNVAAQSGFTVNDIEIPQGGQGCLIINYDFSEADKYQGYQFDLNLPDGISLVSDIDNSTGFDCSKGSCHSPSHSVIINGSGNNYSLLCYSGSNAFLSGTTGALLSLSLQADGNIAVGSIMNGEVGSIKLGYTDVNGEKSESLIDVVFNISIVEPRILLDEDAIVAPESANGINVKVKRTIRPNQWNTICLPFSMSELQVKAAFGNDVELADFNGCDTSFDDDDNVIGINVKFVPAVSIEANHPYIIKVSSNISEFDVDDVDVAPEEYPSVDKDKKTQKVGKITYTFYNSFIGTNKAATLNDINYILFLNGGAFWYAPSQLTIKGYRGYFDFYDVLTSAESQSSAAPVRLSISDNEGNKTEIVDAVLLPVNNGAVFSIGGVYMGTENDVQQLPSGLYILDGEKVIVE